MSLAVAARCQCCICIRICILQALLIAISLSGQYIVIALVLVFLHLIELDFLLAVFDLHILDWFGFEGRELFVFLFTLCSPASSDSEARPRRSALQTQLDSTQLNPTQLASPYRQLLISHLPFHSLPLQKQKSNPI